MIIIVVTFYVKIQRINLSIYSPVKSIQSNLKHLSWVAQRVAAGDYKQHVSSLGRFSASFNQMIKKLWDKDIPCDIVFIDIDGLKYVNDNYGHSKGNHYIKEVCQILKMNLKEDELIFRIGGDELLILSKKEDAHTCEERLLEIRLQFREEMKRKYRIHMILVLIVWILIKNKTISEYLSLSDKKMYHFKMHHYIDQRQPKNSNHIDKSDLDRRVLMLFLKHQSTVTLIYVIWKQMFQDGPYKLSKTLIYLMNILLMQVKFGKNIFIWMIVKNMKKILKQFSLERKNVMI